MSHNEDLNKPENLIQVWYKFDQNQSMSNKIITVLFEDFNMASIGAAFLNIW